MQIQKHLEMLGLRAKDKVTGFEGVVTSVCFDLYGCIVATLTAPADSAGFVQDPRWYDVSRLELVGMKPVMNRPNYDFGPVAEGLKGAAEKPMPR